MNLKDKIAVVTGASSGLGAAMATALVRKGAVVYGLARNEQALEKIKETLQGNFHPIKMDITNESNLKKWVQDTFSVAHSPDILINNAGIGGFKKIDEVETAEWVRMMDTNLNGMFYVTAQLVPLMKQKKTHTHIINIGSILGTMGKEEGAAYCTTKFGVRGFSEALFKELRMFDIKVTCINPGSIETDFFKTSGIQPHDNMLHPEDVAHTIVHVLETPDNMLINELTLRPLNPKQHKSL